MSRTNTKYSSDKNKRTKLTKKAPGAPKRFCSSYILFFMHHQKHIKAALPKDTEQKASEVSKRASKLWKEISPEERLYWKGLAAKEKERYIAEKEVYDGPWEVSIKRAKKDPKAPKRNPSAFLLYSIQKRKELKQSDPGLSNTEISRMLGMEWSKTSDEEKRPFVEQEARDRLVYKQAAAAWKAEKSAKEEKEKLKRSEQTQEKIRIAELHKLEKANDHFDGNDNPQESSKRCDSFEDQGWLDQISDISSRALLQEADIHHPEQYPPVVLSSNFDATLNTGFETYPMSWMASENQKTNFPTQLHPLIMTKQKPYEYFASSSPYHFFNRRIETDDITAMGYFDKRLIDLSPDDCSAFGSNDEQDDHVPIR